MPPPDDRPGPAHLPAGVLSLPLPVRLAGHAWRGRAAELGAAAGLVAAVGTDGLSPSAAVSVAEVLSHLRGSAEALRDGAVRHAEALDAAVDDLEAVDDAVAGEVARLLPGVLPTASGW